MDTDLTPVIIESPFAGDVDKNLRYVRAAMHDCLLRKEAPYASHALYTQNGVLNDDIEVERWLGIHAGFVWRKLAAKTVVYDDFGISKGMAYGIEHAEANGHEVEYRQLPAALMKRVVLTSEETAGLAFSNGTETSNAAAASFKGACLVSMEEQVLRFIRGKGFHGATDDEIEQSLGFRHQTASARRRGLVIQGKVRPSGKRRKTRTGRTATVWQSI